MTKITKVFELIDFIDKARWGEENLPDEGLINFYKDADSLSNDTKLLTHWICYITDRQMPFQRIWDIGGFVFSEMIDAIKENEDLDVLNPNLKKKSFFIKREDYPIVNTFKEKDSEKHIFLSHTETNDNDRLIKRGFKKNDFPYFIPRFYPSDYKSILSTFIILKDFEFNFTKYIIYILEKIEFNRDNFISKLLFGLHLLTYYEIKRPKGEVIDDFINNKQIAIDRKDKVMKILENNKNFENKFEIFRKGIIYKQKRAWCSLRDFIKDLKFKKYFINSLVENNFINVQIFNEEETLKQLELPGDVWNTKPVFINCVLEDTKYNIKEIKKDFPKKLKEDIFKNENIKIGYPEQFDITFDFVPRMCENTNCSICPFGLLNNKANDFDKICINDKSKYCPILLISCNYKMCCVGKNNCPFYKLYK
ncbi:MAG: hypothetical protein KAW92_07565 [Candidatus Cloacimonetes bacterium]|nr:hypothetical protein [Candidatus Cloacimonadota bacterium]